MIYPLKVTSSRLLTSVSGLLDLRTSYRISSSALLPASRGKSKLWTDLGVIRMLHTKQETDTRRIQKRQLIQSKGSSNSCRVMSSISLAEKCTSTGREDAGPFGDLFISRIKLGDGLVGQCGSIHRTFGPRDNSTAILATGGEALAAHASFDPDYKRAQGWIRQHAVGPAVLSPVLLQGLTGALSEAAFPEGVLVSQSMTQNKPLIVGVAVRATIEVTRVEPSTRCMNEQSGEKNGYLLHLRSQVSRVRDDELIVEGTKLIWIPDYENM